VREEQQIAGNQGERDQENDQQRNHNSIRIYASLTSTSQGAACLEKSVRNIARVHRLTAAMMDSDRRQR
jgi:hypothetical protein